MSITLKEFTTRARELRRKRDAAEKEFLDYLVWGEKEDFWRESGLTYLELLDQLSLVKPARYDAYKQMKARHGSVVARVGINAIVEAAKFKESTSQREVLDQAVQWETTNETPISPQSAAIIGRDLRSRETAIKTRNKGYNQLVAELETARREVARLSEENKNLRAELAVLKRSHKIEAKKSTRAKA